MILHNFRARLQTPPDSAGGNARVWHIRKDEHIRINLVEMSGELKLHSHPDADHSVMVIEGRVRALVGEETHTLGVGDFLSIPKGVPHKYWPEGTSYIVSMDAPYYDPKKTIVLE